MTSLIHIVSQAWNKASSRTSHPSSSSGDKPSPIRSIAAVGVALLGIIGLGTAALTPNPAIAAENDKSIIIQAGTRGEIIGHTFAVAPIATFNGDDSAELTTVSQADSAVREAIKAALQQEAPEGADPLMWAQAVSGTPIDQSTTFPWAADASSRLFADALADYVKTNGTQYTATQDPLAITGLQGGLYAIVDVTTKLPDSVTDMPASVRSLTMLVGTKHDIFKTDGSVIVKNEAYRTPPTKTVTGDQQGTVRVGDELTYHITGTVPSTTGKGDDFTYVFEDYASRGLSIDTSKSNITVTYGKNGTALPAADYTVDPAEQSVDGKGVGDGSAPTFTVTIARSVLDTMQSAAGEAFTVTYKATVNDYAADDQVAGNRAQVTVGGVASGKSTTVNVYTNTFQFEKYFADGSTVTGARFTLYDADNSKPVQMHNKDYAADVDEHGRVTFSGLEDGTYTVRETRVADGAAQVTGSFKVTLTYDATGQRTVVTFSDTGLDPYDLVTADEDGAIRVRNVKSLTELPLTGAAGGMVIAGSAAVLLALAGVSLAIIRRMERRM